jgi:hypothetical protein
MSDALIMGGTFAALMFSGVDMLLELGADHLKNLSDFH